MGQNLIYRDDDINYLTSADELKRIHEPFARRGIVHTVAVEFYRLWENKSLFHFLKTDPFIDVELHGWRHSDYSGWVQSHSYSELQKSIQYWETFKGIVPEELGKLKTITTHFPTWNKTSDSLALACDELNLKLSYDRNEYAWHFHYWEVTAQDVEDVLSGQMTGKEKQKQIKRNATTATG